MKSLFLLFISIVLLGFVAFNSHQNILSVYSKLSLKQEIQLLENNALRNILREQNLFKRSQILELALNEIEKLRSQSALQLKNDEKAISKMVTNLKSLNSQNQAQYKGSR